MAAIAAILATGLFATRNIEVGRSRTVSAGAPSDDEIYTGSILFVPNDGEICRQFLFDNRTGRLNYNGFVNCELAYSDSAKGASRALIISKGFRGR